MNHQLQDRFFSDPWDLTPRTTQRYFELERDPQVRADLPIAVVGIGHVGHEVIPALHPELKGPPQFVFGADPELHAHVQILRLV